MDLKFLVGQNFSQRPKIKSFSADFFFTDKVFRELKLSNCSNSLMYHYARKKDANAMLLYFLNKSDVNEDDVNKCCK